MATINHHVIGLPRTIALLLGSLGVSLLIAIIDPHVTPDLSGWMRGMLGAAGAPQILLDMVLGLLLFAASLHVDLTELRQQKWTVLALATASVIIATIVFGAGIWVLFRLARSSVELKWCMVLGALLAPTCAAAPGAAAVGVERPRFPAKARSTTAPASCCFRSCYASRRVSTGLSAAEGSPPHWRLRVWVVAGWDA